MRAKVAKCIQGLIPEFVSPKGEFYEKGAKRAWHTFSEKDKAARRFRFELATGRRKAV